MWWVMVHVWMVLPHHGICRLQTNLQTNLAMPVCGMQDRKGRETHNTFGYTGE